MMVIVRKSPFSGVVREMLLDITEGEYNAWEAGVVIQRAMPRLSPSEREFVMTGITDDEWAELFAE